MSPFIAVRDVASPPEKKRPHKGADETVAPVFPRQACIYKMSRHATVSLMRYFNPDGTGAPTNRRCQSRSRTGSVYENATHSVSPTLHGPSFISPFMGVCVLASARQNKQF